MKKKSNHRLFPRLAIPDERPLNEDLLLALKSSVRPLAELYNDVAVPKQVRRCEGGCIVLENENNCELVDYLCIS